MGHSILNIEGVAAALFLASAVWRARGPQPDAASAIRVPDWAVAAAVVVATAAAFLQVLWFPLLHDSYDLIYVASTESLRDVMALFHRPSPMGDLFFRPLTFSIVWAYSQWAQFDPMPWHVLCLGIHLANCALVYLLARHLSLSQLAAATAALFFALHGTRPEAVAWFAARVDLLATFFVLLTLVAANRLMSTGDRRWFIVIGLCAAAACLSKESAYSLPLLVLTLLPFRRERRCAGLLVVSVTLLCGALFGYRYWVIGSIGGYGASAGNATVLHLDLLRTLNALFFREWAILFFPINWSEWPGVGLALALGLMGSAMVLAVWRPLENRQKLLAGLAFTIAAVLPVQHLLLLGTDLNGARVLYLPVVGLALFWGVVVSSHRVAVALGLLVFQVCALEHNLTIWRTVASVSQHVCADFAAEVARDNSAVTVDPLPIKRKGVFFLNNGFPPCVLMNSAGKLVRLPDVRQIPSGESPKDLPHYRWDDSGARLDRVY